MIVFTILGAIAAFIFTVAAVFFIGYMVLMAIFWRSD